jgi:hypothetical protein
MLLRKKEVLFYYVDYYQRRRHPGILYTVIPTVYTRACSEEHVSLVLNPIPLDVGSVYVASARAGRIEAFASFWPCSSSVQSLASPHCSVMIFHSKDA